MENGFKGEEHCRKEMKDQQFMAELQAELKNKTYWKRKYSERSGIKLHYRITGFCHKIWGIVVDWISNIIQFCYDVICG